MMFRKRVRLTIGLTLLGLLLSGLGAARVVRESRAANSAKQVVQRQENRQDDPTPIQEGVMTEKQKKNGKLFKGYQDITKGKKLRDLVAEQGDVSVGKMLPQRIRSNSFSLDKYLQTLTCKANIVVTGTVKSKSSQLIEEGTFLFTDYEITVEESLKNSGNGSVQPNASINVIRVGGAVKLNAIDYEQPPLQVGGHYLLFLTYVPETDSYTSAFYGVGEDSFQLRGNKLTQVSGVSLPLGKDVATDADFFIAQVRNALANTCATGGTK
jgi:hypothetical protein